MTRARAFRVSLLGVAILAVGACATQKKPLTGFEKQPPGTIALDDDNGGVVVLWPMFDLTQSTQQTFRPRFNGQDVVYTMPPDNFYDYYIIHLQGWTAGWPNPLRWIKPDTYVVELVDDAGQSWGQSAPLAIAAAAGNPLNPSGQVPAIVFAHFAGKVRSWNVDPATQDSDTATDEITVTNLVGDDVVVERCLIVSGNPTNCVPVGTVAAGADLLTVERQSNVTAKDDHQALVIHLASDASPSYQRDLLQGTGSLDFGSTCQVERIIVYGADAVVGTIGGTGFAMSSCYGYGSGPG